MAQAAIAVAPLRCSSRPWFSSLFAIKNHQHFIPNSPFSTILRTNALRPPGSLLVEGEPEENSSQKSRNELKREAKRSVKWGMELSNLSNPQIKRVIRVAALEEEVFDALMLVKRLGPDVREGKRRQFNYIGRLLREAQPDLMEALIQASKDGDDSRLQALSGDVTDPIVEEEEEEEDTISEEEAEGCDNHIEVAARWFDGLVYKDPSITNEVYSVHNVEFDRQELRKLVRQVQSIQEGSVAEDTGAENVSVLTRAKKPLIRFLCSLAKKSLAE